MARQALARTGTTKRKRRQARPQQTSARYRSGFVFPVAGGGSFSNDWGAPRQNTGTHKGTDIFAARGTPIVAVVNGTITRMGPQRVGGNRIWINGQWYYAHLDSFAPGMRVGKRVKAGQVIGYVGNTGDAAGTPPHLHFGWDPNGTSGASWANPYDSLRNREIIPASGIYPSGAGSSSSVDNDFGGPGGGGPDVVTFDADMIQGGFDGLGNAVDWTPEHKAETWQRVSAMPLSSSASKRFFDLASLMVKR